MSKGHASPLLYALWTAAGEIQEKELMTLRKFGSRIEGHPRPNFSFADVATGSLGQGLSIGVGMCLGLESRLHQEALSSGLNRSAMPSPHVNVLVGDGELMEGQIWEAVSYASYRKLHRLTALVDINTLGQSQPTIHGNDIEAYRKKFESFGWGVICIDGHSFSEISAAFEKVLIYRDGPTAILARTIKGKGVSFLENRVELHGIPVKKEELQKAVGELGKVNRKLRGAIGKPECSFSPLQNNVLSKMNTMIEYKQGEFVATRKAFGNALLRLSHVYPHMVVFDGDMQNSTFTQQFGKEYPDRFFQSYIAEQNMVSMAHGMSVTGFTPWISTFGAFLTTRGHDQIRMAALSGATLKINGAHGGVSIGQDGPSQMALEDIAVMRAIPGSTVLYPADAVSTERLTEALMKTEGIGYIRTQRPDTPVIYASSEMFPIGGCKVHKGLKGKTKEKGSVSLSRKYNSGGRDKPVLIIAAGITVIEALNAQKELMRNEVDVIVIDCYSIKPIDADTINAYAANAKGIIVVEDHYPEGGLGEAVLSALKHKPDRFVHLAVRRIPGSGKPEELLAFEQIHAKAIIRAIRSIKTST
jgi:transketolase